MLKCRTGWGWGLQTLATKGRVAEVKPSSAARPAGDSKRLFYDPANAAG